MHSKEFDVVRRDSSLPIFPRIVVAIPICNEAERIEACLDAIANARTCAGEPFDEPVGIVPFVNDSTDTSFDIVRAWMRHRRVPVRLYDARMAPRSSHAGGARRAALDLAARWLRDGDRSDGILFTTDADSQPAPGWIAAGCAAIRHGADCVAGPIDLYPEDEASLPAHVQARGRLEAQYERLLTELFSRLDPRKHDPWPRHAAEAGANLAITLRAFDTIGGCPDRPCGEDRAMVSQVDRRGMRVRHEPTMRVATSGRLFGRAAGGVADTIRLRCAEPEALCDDYLEPALNARFRGFWRGRLRAIFEAGGAASAREMSGFVDGSAPEDASFGAFWEVLERTDPRLARVLLRPSDLPGEIAAATVMVEQLRPRPTGNARGGPTDSPLSVPAG